ncbi:GtrA family protein [Xanthomonas sp. CFBP 8703]|jgi:putative flippase GtrA|uniref:GtrA family protein n=1 Tax=Xanthomonas bonasiae TaxID=2810351 RepID=A0ABS3B596_9XANT|nr:MULTISPECIES: GtrA family protein [Xanthomonas]MBN6103774.1 GtrA family protein [Xanthomonas bonasiae]MBN6113066.1 GtrA family protein [Xanthomonas bonasiae]NYF21478.1 putative flippase GtrA [Xanthomonas sp. JAI131]
MSLLRQGSQFVVIGLLQLLIDWSVFVAATAAGMPPIPANVLGRVCGALLGFWLNGRITFASGDGARLGWQRFGRFMAVWILMTLLSTWLVALCVDALGLRLAWLAKPVVEGLLAVLSFFVGRHVVYR